MNEFAKTIEMLAGKLGVATTRLLEIYTAQARLEGITDGVWAAFWLVAAVVTFWVALRYWLQLWVGEHRPGPIIALGIIYLTPMRE